MHEVDLSRTRPKAAPCANPIGRHRIHVLELSSSSTLHLSLHGMCTIRRECRPYPSAACYFRPCYGTSVCPVRLPHFELPLNIGRLHQHTSSLILLATLLPHYTRKYRQRNFGFVSVKLVVFVSVCMNELKEREGMLGEQNIFASLQRCCP